VAKEGGFFQIPVNGLKPAEYHESHEWEIGKSQDQDCPPTLWTSQAKYGLEKLSRWLHTIAWIYGGIKTGTILRTPNIRPPSNSVRLIRNARGIPNIRERMVAPAANPRLFAASPS